MFIWEHKLLVRRRACEFRLYDKRDSHTRMASYRTRFTPDSPAHRDCSKYMATLQREIKSILNEIQFVIDLGKVGPVAQNEIAVSAKDSQLSVTLLNLLDREADHVLGDQAFDKIEEAKAFSDGIKYATRILLEPREFLTDDEKVAYDAFEVSEEDEAQRHSRYRTTIHDRGSFINASAPKSKRAPKAKIVHAPETSVTITVVNGVAKVVN